jgi:hypothetical protein
MRQFKHSKEKRMINALAHIINVHAKGDAIYIPIECRDYI